MEKIVFISKNNHQSHKVFDFLKSNYDAVWENNIKIIIGLNPDYVIMFHWSEILPKKFYEKINCICVHTGNLPKDRGGSPIQNQILKVKSSVELI